MNVNEGTAGAISTLAFQLCLVNEDETIEAIKGIHASLVDEYLKLDSEEGAAARARRFLNLF